MNTMSISEKIKQDFVPALISGGLSAAMYTLVFGESLFTPIEFFNMGIPAGFIVGGTVAGSHLIGNVLQDHVLGLVESNLHAKITGRLIKPIISGAASFAIFKFGFESPNPVESIALGAVPVIASEYVYDSFLGGRH